MDSYLTVKQLQDLLKVDRITIYRMLQDGRLKGVKIGQQWRFAHRDVEELLSGVPSPDPEPPATASPVQFPSHCIGSIQEIVSAIAGVGVVTVDLEGQPLTGVSHACEFCALLQSTPSGRDACLESWRKMAVSGTAGGGFATCHAGLQYAQARIGTETDPVGWLLAGQFTLQPPSPTDGPGLAGLSSAHRLPLSRLEAAAHKRTVLDAKQMESIQIWLEKVATAVNSILSERAVFVDRLRKIAEISGFHP